ncbi:MAG: rRNA maturation RNase YbeY [Bacteroidales bacterium]|nr:rRNA maturation RNase YbeY [Bacteroidales bacterium]
MSISFHSQLSQFALDDEQKLRQWITAVAKIHHKEVANIAYLFCDDEYILSANRQYLQHDTYTDIITFDYCVADTLSGDILISIDRVSDNANQFGVAFTDELHRVIIHGILHLVGFADKTDQQASIMRTMEDQALKLWELV